MFFIYFAYFCITALVLMENYTFFMVSEADGGKSSRVRSHRNRRGIGSWGNTSQTDLDAAPWGHLPIHGLDRRSYYLFYIIIINRDEANGFFSPPKEKVAYTDESHKENHL